MKNLVKPTQALFCTKCGAQLIESMVGAEKHLYNDEGGGYPAYEPYDETTGKRQYVYQYTCPSKRWWNFHNSYTVDKVIKI